jgi:hypothetical protein
LRLLHDLAQSHYDENHSRSSGHDPLAIELPPIFYVNLIGRRFPEHDGNIFGEGFKGLVVIEGERRKHDVDPDLKAAR